ncbi:MAG: transposase [Planctomycetaceae bacterium]
MNDENTEIEFGLFDREAGVEASRRNLPHWFQPNVAVFVTFRTADSLPREVVLRWEAEQRDWLRQQGWVIGADVPLPKWDQLPESLQKTFRQHRDHRWHWHLDSCHGECVLRRRELAEIVMNSLKHFDGDRYDLDCAVVMPNHVHLLTQFHPPTTCRGQGESWLHYTAVQINKSLGRKNAFWQSEPFDHLVRSADQFEYLQRYIAENGSKANLPETDYLFWKR